MALGCATASGSASTAHPFRAGVDDRLEAYVPFADLRLGPDMIEGGMFTLDAHNVVGGLTPTIKNRRLQEPALVSRASSGEIELRVGVYAIRRDELDLEKDYEAWLETSDGARLRGRIEHASGLRDLSQWADRTLVDFHRQTVRIHDGARTTSYTALSPESDRLVFTLFARVVKFTFEKPGLLSPATKRITLVVKGEGRIRKWTWNFVK